ncbi:hypothetical protein ACA086_10260 [Muriicola sp. E247]|uniref:hypothetical protein n=1 Tax=Muriicola sp. E247 TaxID=3242730 RepID=UPI003523EBEF
MAKNRFDNKIREVLDERTINPSKDSWSVIETHLGSAKTTKRGAYWKYAVAAGFIGIVFISIFLLSPEADETIPGNEVVNSTNETERDVPAIMEEEPSELKSVIAVQSESENETSYKPEQQMEMNSEIAEVSQEYKEENIQQSAKEILQAEKLEIKIAEVVAQVAILEETKGVVSDEVIDSLLMEAQAELLNKRPIQNYDRVDALALLADVEEEVNRSFRDQLFEKLKDGYLKVRTAIAYRNE